MSYILRWLNQSCTMSISVCRCLCIYNAITLCINNAITLCINNAITLYIMQSPFVLIMQSPFLFGFNLRNFPVCRAPTFHAIPVGHYCKPLLVNSNIITWDFCILKNSFDCAVHKHMLVGNNYYTHTHTTYTHTIHPHTHTHTPGIIIK